MASYKELSKGNWKVTISLGFDEKGKRRKVIKQGFRTKRDAEKFTTDILTKKNRGYISPGENNILFKDFIMDWFTNYKLNQLNNAIMQKFYNDLINEKKNKAVSTIKVMDIVNCSLKYAQKLKLIYELPTDINKQKLEKPKIEHWNKSEIDFFLEHVKGTYMYTPVFIDILTGLRIGELCGLRWCDIDLEKGIITVNNQLIHDKRLKVLILADLKTSSSHRNITIPKKLINYLRELKEDRGASDNDYVVLDRNDFKYTPRNLSMNFTKKVSKFKKPIEENESSKAEYMQLKQISFHGLRHTHATLLILNGENVKVVSERLGHADIRMTLNTYTHVMQDMKNNTANLLDDLF